MLILYKKTFALIFILYLQSGSYISNEWDLAIEREGIRVYLHQNWKENSTYKAEGVVDVPQNQLYAFLSDIKNYPHWINGCMFTRVLYSNSELHYRYYATYDLPWPLRNRDAVADLTIRKLPDGKILATIQAIDTDTLQSGEYVRETNFSEKYELIPEEQTTILRMQGSYTTSAYLPDWVIKKFLTWGPYDTFLSIRKASAKYEPTK